ncbi:MAG: hypothetical protein K5Q68_04485 [Roseococcus sp.]|nr:hypothetical protein [Roseococcus sp.]
MPSFDGGHYFLTALIPVRMDAVEDPMAGGQVTSHLHALREVLAALPTALQSPATEKIGVNAPFARESRTHFTRLVILDDVAFNGRNQRDPIKVAIAGPPPTQFDPVDRLDGAFLIYVADFDAADGSAETVDGYLRGLWSVMGEEWRAILAHCHRGAAITDGSGFARYIRGCELETTMPFNDYWPGAPPLAPLSLKPFINLALGAVAALVLGLVIAPFAGAAWLWLALAGLLGLAGVAGAALFRIMRAGQKPFPAAPRSDLPSVLKALYLQQRFTRFAIATQGESPAALYAGFAEFLARHRPGDVTGPTQPRGVVRS